MTYELLYSQNILGRTEVRVKAWTLKLGHFSVLQTFAKPQPQDPGLCLGTVFRLAGNTIGVCVLESSSE